MLLSKFGELLRTDRHQ